MKDLSYLPNHPNTGGWKDRHQEAVRRKDRVAGGSVATAIECWCNYARGHALRFESKIGEDYVLGPAWATWGAALRTLLNGDMGNFDCGTLDTILCNNLTEQGFDPDQL